MINRYLRERGDANIKTNADLIAKATFYDDPNFPNRQAAREQAERATALDTSARMHTRFALQTLLMQCMAGAEARRAGGADVHRAAEKAACPARAAKQRPHADRLVLFGSAGIPGDLGAGRFHDRRLGPRREGNETRLVGPIPAKLPVGVDFIAPSVRRAAAVPDRGRIRSRDEEPAAARGFGPLP